MYGGSVGLVACVIWLHWCAARDGALHDVLLFLTGFSIIYYTFTRWDRAKHPILGGVGCVILFALGVGIAALFRF
jgi:hypothetical protein